MEHPAFRRDGLVDLLVLHGLLCVCPCWPGCLLLFRLQLLAVLLELHVALDVFEDQLVLHAGIEHYEAVRCRGEVGAALDVLVLAEDELSVFRIV